MICIPLRLLDSTSILGLMRFPIVFFGVLRILNGKHFVSMFLIGVGKYSFSPGFRHVGAVLHVFSRIFLRLADLDWLTWLAGMGCVGWLPGSLAG